MTTVVMIAHTRKHGTEGGNSSPGHLLRGSGDLWALARSVVGVRLNKGVTTIEAEGNYVTNNEPVVHYILNQSRQRRSIDGPCAGRTLIRG